MALDKKLADYLWTARWATKAGKPEVAYDEITKALVHIGAEKSSPDPLDETDIGPIPEATEKVITPPEFVVVKGVRFRDRGAYRTPSGQFEGLVVHYTVSGRTAKSAIGVVNYLASQGYGCMVMDEDGKIYIPEGFDIFRSVGAHAGLSKWNGRTGLNSYYAGMEICNWGRGSKVGPFRVSKAEDNIIAGTYQTYTPEQEFALTNFILWAEQKNKEFKLSNVCGHDEARTAYGKPGDKQDPGGALSMTMPNYRKYLEAKKKLIA